MEINDTWRAGEGEIDGTPFIIRYRPFLHNFITTGEYKHRMEIFWPYETSQPALMPEDEDHRKMLLLEDKLAAAFEKDQLAVLAFVYTGHLQNVWHWYTSDVKEAGLRMNQAMDGFEDFQIEMTVEEDQGWQEYLSMLDSAVEEDEDDPWNKQ